MLPTIAPLSPLIPERWQLTVQGMVQGVGFRPFVYGLATELGLTGWVQNSSQGVTIAVEGTPAALSRFLERLQQEKPPHSELHHVSVQQTQPLGEQQFLIRPSLEDHQPKTALILPDLATCSACLQEIFDPQNRRYRYPFTNCTHCGPRFSILESLPYDRPNTTMQRFQMCPDCQAEYGNPRDRRFHAQPNACPVCGPQLELWNQKGQVLAAQDQALQQTVAAIQQGKIVAIKGLGGFHLVVDAQNETAVQQLRQRKQRPDKPLAVMVPSLAWVQQQGTISDLEAQLLQFAEAPIVLIRGSWNAAIAPSVAPQNPDLGIMLPYTPLHHLLLQELQTPIVATSGNVSNEPICTDEQVALESLGTIADLFLIHNRPIARPVDDSIVRVVHDRPLILRRARGYTPLPMTLSTATPASVLAVGAHLKNTVALAFNDKILLSQHLGDLETPETLVRFQSAVDYLLKIYEITPAAIACDLHPDYYSSQFAHHQTGLTLIPVQHHYAHVLSCMVDQAIAPPVLGVAWDGTGYGSDGTIWGGEFLVIPENPAQEFERVAHWRTFALPGGEQAVKEPRRSLLGLLYAAWGDSLFEQPDLTALLAFQSSELKILRSMLQRQMNSPLTSSAGRFFDAISALLNLCQRASFEGQAALQLEAAIANCTTESCYPFTLGTEQPIQIDWQPIVAGILQDRQAQIPGSEIAAKFHNTLVEVIVAIAHRIGIPKIALTGGCFQNRYLLEKAIQCLQKEGFVPFWHQGIPSNDGGIAVGQVMAAVRRLQVTQEVK